MIRIAVVRNSNHNKRFLFSRLRTLSSTSNNNTVSLKEQILQASLQRVPEYGWTDDAIVAGSIDYASKQASSSASSSISLAGMITINDLVSYSMNQWNDRLRKEIQEKVATTNVTSSSTTTTDLLFDAIQLRLSYIQKFIQSNRWHEGMAHGIHPTQIITTQQQIHDIVTIISDYIDQHLCCVNDESSLSYLEKFGISAIYITTELHMLNDTSIDYIDTWQFLKDRILEWDQLRHQQITVPFVPTLPSSNILPKSDTLYTLSHIVSSLSTGAVSVLYPAASQYFVHQSNQSNSNPISTVIGTITSTIPSILQQQPVGAAIFQQQQQQQQTPNNRTTLLNNDGTDPSHYNTASNKK